MNKIKSYFFLTLLCYTLLLVYTACSTKKDNTVDYNYDSSSIDLPEILKKGKLTILAENSSTSYFIYRAKKMGFEYEVLKEFADEIGVDLEIKIVGNLDNLTEMINNGEGDLIACNYTVTRERKSQIDFSVPFIRTPQVLIQRKPKGWEKLSKEQIDAQLIRDPVQLANKKVNVWKNSSNYQRLIHLQEEIGDTIYLEEEPGSMGTEELIEMVSEGLIDYTVTEENIARVNSHFFENIDCQTIISVRQKIAFGMRKSSPLLKARLDKWLNEFMAKKTFRYLKSKYFELQTSPLKPAVFLSSAKGGDLSPFDASFKRAALKYEWDWLLLASVAYHESKFNPNVRGFGGAYGMMQFMPSTGPKYGVYPSSPPDVQIMGGMKKIYKDFALWNSIPDKTQREKFTLATYNAGKSHVDDAQRLARKHGLNPLIWDNNVEVMMLNLSKGEYYRDEVVKNGALRGARTYHYVRAIYSRYLDWKAIYK